MKRTVRCLVLLALGAGAWACRGNPTSDLDRGTPTGLQADPSALFIDQGSSVGVIVEAKDALNQVVEMSGISSSAGTGIIVVRDSTYNRIYDANGKLVLPENPTRARFVVTGNNAIQTSFTVNSNGLSLTVPVRVVPIAVLPPLSTTTPGYGEDVTLTLQDDITIDPDVVADPAQWQGLVQFPGLPDGLVSDVQAQSITFQVPPNVNGPATVRRIVMPYAPAVDSLTLETSEDIVSPVLDTVAVTLSNNTPAGLDIVTITLNETEVRFGAASEFGLEGTDGNCSLDAACTKMVVESRAPDGTSVNVFMPPDITGQLWISGVEPINAMNFPTDVRGDKNIAVGASTFNVALSNATPTGIDEVVTVTPSAGFSFASDAVFSAGASCPSVGAGCAAGLTQSVAADGSSADVIFPAGASGVMFVEGAVRSGFNFDLGATQSITVGTAGGFGTAVCDPATAPVIVMPTPGNSITITDHGDFCGALDDSRYFQFVLPADTDFSNYHLVWNSKVHGDLGAYTAVDAAFTTLQACTADGFGGQDGGPEDSGACTLSAGAYILAVVTFDVPSIDLYQLTITAQ